MERDKAIKVGVASVILLVAIVLIAMNLFGKSNPKPHEDTTTTKTTQPSGGPRSAPGANDD